MANVRDYRGTRLRTFVAAGPTVERNAGNVVWRFVCERCGAERKLTTSHIGHALRSPRRGVRPCSCEPQPEPETTLEPTPTRDSTRSRRKREIRKRTVSVTRMTKRELELGRLLYPERDNAVRPRTRAECVDGPRPCPFVGCKFALYLDVNERTGSITLNFPDLEPDELSESCALDVADRGGETLEDVGAIMNLTRERIRQLEVRALARLERADAKGKLRDHADEGEVGRRRLPVLNDHGRHVA